MNKKGATNNNQLIGIILILAFGGLMYYLSTQPSSPISTTLKQNQTVVKTPCNLNSEVTLGKAYDISGVGAMNGVKHTYFINGNYGGEATDGTTITASADDKLDVYLATNTSAAKDTNNYYGKLVNLVVPCGPIKSDVGLWRNSSLTISVYNTPGNSQIITANNNVSIAASSSVNMLFDLKSEAYKGFSPDSDLVVDLQANATQYTRFQITGDGWERTDCPLTSLNPSSITGIADWCFKHKGIKDGDKVSGTISVQTGTDDPTVDAGAGNQIILNVFDTDYYIDTETKKPAIGMYNNKGQEVGFAKQTSTITVS